MCIAQKILKGEVTYCEKTYEELRYAPQLLLGLIQRLFMSMADFADFKEPGVNRSHSKLAF